MDIDKYLELRQDIINDSMDESGFPTQLNLLAEILPYMQEAKLLDSDDYNESYYYNEKDNIKLNAYTINESGERLQLFIIDEKSLDQTLDNEALKISQKDIYEHQFKRALRFISNSHKNNFDSTIQDSDRAKVLSVKLASNEGIEQFDVFEIFLITLTASVSFKGSLPQPRNIYFEPKNTIYKIKKEKDTLNKEVLILKRVIDLNFIYNEMLSRGRQESLIVNFKKTFGESISAIKAASEKNFESYLCVLSADIIYNLYRLFSSRLLEKNVRSFLQFRGVNKGIKETIRKSPEKFIAYNNGLTITANDSKITENKKGLFIDELTDFQIVNGGQTTASIYFSKKDGLDISKVRVMAKINVAKNVKDSELDELIANISKYSNSQSRVSNVDLRARNPQLVKLKSLSESVSTPSGHKWFFERAKGEFNTKLRMNVSSAARLKREYPTSRRFSKEQLAKYYSAWGMHPYMVKKGGEKIFRYFIESISTDDNGGINIEIDRLFYEQLVSKIILFRSLEKIYGQGKNSIGQLRSAVIPYTLSTLYAYTDNIDNIQFNLGRIWKTEVLEEDISEYFRQLMVLMNKLIIKYSRSDDYGEYSKKKELWEDIIKSSEINKFMSNEISKTILNKYTVIK